MSIDFLIPAVIVLPMLSGLGLWLIEKKYGTRVLNVCSVIAAAAVLVLAALLWLHTGEEKEIPLLLGLGIGFRTGGFRLVLVSLSAFLWFVTTAFSPYYFSGHGGTGRYQLFSFLTWGAINGVFLSADFFTMLVFFEIMSVTSWVMVIHEQTPESIDAASSYLGYAITGGLCTMLGLFMLQNIAGTLSFSALSGMSESLSHNALYYTAGVFILTGFAVKCGMWPLHTWLPAAHPAAPATASALLSGIITKAGIFGVCAVSVTLFLNDYSWGIMLLCLGAVTMFTGAALAVFSIDIKKTLACSSMSQLGFILVGIGMQRLLGENSVIAVYGTVLHVVNHSTLKLCLFLCAGVIVHCRHSRNLNELKGFGRGKPLFLIAFLCGTLGITCMPLFGGYVSKTLLHESILEYILILQETGRSWGFFKAVEILFLISGGLTVAYMTKLFTALFIDRNAGRPKMDAMNGKYISPAAGALLIISAAVSPVLGSFAHLTMDNIAALCTEFFNSREMEYAVEYFSPVNLKGAAISLAIGMAVYFGIIRTLLMKNGEYLDVWPEKLDIEKSLYRPLLLKWLPAVFGAASRLASDLFNWLLSLAAMLLNRGSENIAVNETDDSFALYPKDNSPRGVTATLAYGLALAGLTLVAVFAWVLLRL